MPLSQLRTNVLPNSSLPDGSTPDQLAGRAGEALAAELHGKYYTQAYRGNVFVGTAAIGGVAPAISTTTTTNTFGLWNPAGSGKNLVPIRYLIGFAAGTASSVAGNIVYTYSTGVGSATATAAPISTFTTITPVSTYLGSGIASIAKFSAVAGGIVQLAAGTFLKTSGISQLAMNATSSTVATGWSAFEDFDGTLIMPPGSLLVVGANAAVLTVFNQAMVWEEVPV